MTAPSSPRRVEAVWKVRVLETVQRLAFEHRRVYREQYLPGAGPETGTGADRAYLEGLETLRAEAETHARAAGLDNAKITDARLRGLRGIRPEDRLVQFMLASNPLREMTIDQLVHDLWVLEQMAVLDTARQQTGTAAQFQAPEAMVKQYHHNAILRWTRADAVASGVSLSAAETDGLWAASAHQWRTIAAGTLGHRRGRATLEERWHDYAAPWDEAPLPHIDAARHMITELGGQPVPIPSWETMLAQARDAVTDTRAGTDHPITEAIHAALPDGQSQEWTPQAGTGHSPDPTMPENRPEPEP